MRVVTWEAGSTPIGDAVAALGAFDGVHLGHQALIASAKRDAEGRGLACVAVTFDRDPDLILAPTSVASQLLTLPDKCLFLGQAGADTVVVVPFDAPTAALTPDGFVTGVLLSLFRPHALHVGADFRFGRGATGDAATLASVGRKHGFGVVPHDLVCAAGSPVTSTRIRTLIATGDVRGAAGLLGRDHRVAGRVVHGRGAGGHDLGVPTANIRPVPRSAVPADGVYAGWVTIANGAALPAAISVGIPPTFPEATDGLEVHILDYHGNLYGSEVRVGFTKRTRGLVRFDSRDALARAIRDDIRAVRRVLAL